MDRQTNWATFGYFLPQLGTILERETHTSGYNVGIPKQNLI